MVDTIGQTPAAEGHINKVMDHKLAPAVLALLAYLALDFVNGFRGSDADLSAKFEKISLEQQRMKLTLTLIEERTKRLDDGAPNRWTRGKQDVYAQGVDKQLQEINRRLNEGGL